MRQQLNNETERTGTQEKLDETIGRKTVLENDCYYGIFIASSGYF